MNKTNPHSCNAVNALATYKQNLKYYIKAIGYLFHYNNHGEESKDVDTITGTYIQSAAQHYSNSLPKAFDDEEDENDWDNDIDDDEEDDWDDDDDDD